MKTKLLIATLTLAACLTAGAQTNPAPITPGGWAQSAIAYFTSRDTNSTTFDGAKFELWTGLDYVNNLNTANSIGIEYNLSPLLSVESVTKNAGVAGVVVSQQGGLGLNMAKYDTKLTAYLDGGYDFTRRKPFGEVGLRAKKATTKNTYIGIGLGLKVDGSKDPLLPTFSVIVGAVL